MNVAVAKPDELEVGLDRRRPASRRRPATGSVPPTGPVSVTSTVIVRPPRRGPQRPARQFVGRVAEAEAEREEHRPPRRAVPRHPDARRRRPGQRSRLTTVADARPERADARRALRHRDRERLGQPAARVRLCRRAGSPTPVRATTPSRPSPTALGFAFHTSRTPSTAGSHGIVTGPSVASTTIVGTFAATAAITASWSPGRSIELRSIPSSIDVVGEDDRDLGAARRGDARCPPRSAHRRSSRSGGDPVHVTLKLYARAAGELDEGGVAAPRTRRGPAR